MAIDYKLVKLNGTRIVTGQELKDSLNTEGFTPLALARQPAMPPKPVKREDESQAQFDARYIAWFNGPYKVWQAVCNQRVADCNDFELVLRHTFEIATWTKTGQYNKDGTPIYGWVIKHVISPPYPSFAQKISGLRSPYKPKTLDWICFKTFYT